MNKSKSIIDGKTKIIILRDKDKIEKLISKNLPKGFKLFSYGNGCNAEKDLYCISLRKNNYTWVHAFYDTEFNLVKILEFFRIITHDLCKDIYRYCKMVESHMKYASNHVKSRS